MSINSRSKLELDTGRAIDLRDCPTFNILSGLISDGPFGRDPSRTRRAHGMNKEATRRFIWLRLRPLANTVVNVKLPRRTQECRFFLSAFYVRDVTTRIIVRCISSCMSVIRRAMREKEREREAGQNGKVLF